MRPMDAIAVAATIALGVLAGLAAPARGQAPATGVTVFEGARLIVGDQSAPMGPVMLVVDGTRMVPAGRAADVRVPAGATRVNLTGKTVMPDAAVDTHRPSRSDTRSGHAGFKAPPRILRRERRAEPRRGQL